MTLNDFYQLLNDSPYDYYFLIVDEFLDINLPNLHNFYPIYANKNGIQLKEKNSGRLLSHPKVTDFIKTTSLRTGRQPAIIPFKPSPRIDKLCQSNNWTPVCNPSPLNRLFEDKIKFYTICQQANLPVIPSIINPFNYDNFIAAQDSFGPNLVIQSHFGWAGSSTFSANTWSDIEKLIPQDIIVKFSPFIKSFTLTNNCCLTKYGLIQSPPALQYTGIAPYTQNPFTTVGRQWPAPVDSSIKTKINQISEDFSKILSQNNFKGFFGLDFLIKNEQVFLLECNPRLTASFSFYTTLEENQNIIPLFLLHLAEHLNINYSLDIHQEQSRFNNPSIVGSEIVFKDKDNQTTRKLHFSYPLSDSTDPVVLKL